MIEEAVSGRGFEIIEQLGAGGFGVVYRAHQPSVGRDVAIKVILPDIAQDPLFIKRFEKEARLAAQLEHPNIIPLYDYWQDEECAYLVMRWVRSGTLKESLTKGPWEPAKVIHLVDQVTGALEAAHEQGVVHRDLKPSNILIDEKGNAYLTDFGIAKHLVGTTIGTPAGAIIGSPAYMAPEQIRGEDVTPRSDLYSLGGLIYEVLTGEPPFGLDDPAAMLYRHLHEPLPLVCDICPELPSAVDTVLQKATSKDPAKRYTDASSLAEAFAVAIRRPELITIDPFLDKKVTDVPHNLPVQSTHFVGREEELADLERLLGDPNIRLVTIVGPGGMGKTRLALAAAEHHLDIHLELNQDGGPRYPDGIFFVPLDGLDTPEQIVPEIARSLGLRLVNPGESSGGMDTPERTSEEQLLDYLSNKRLLLVVDNFEHLMEGAGLIAEIRKRAPETQILLTSREKLGLHGEQLYQLKGMRVPGVDGDVASADRLLAGYSSSRLFLQSAGRNAPGFTLQTGEIKELAQVCRLVDGMPLALELAAGWVDILPLRDIAAEIRRGMDFLETDTLDIPERQRSVQAIFDGTWRRLEQVEQALFTQLCVFQGGFTRQAAQEITGATLRQLARLMNKSIMLFDRKVNRYQIHRLLRYYGLEKLADDPIKEQAFRDGHCDFYCDVMKRCGEAMKGSGQRQALEEMEADSQNILAAWEWAVRRPNLSNLDESVEALHFFFARSGLASQWGEACNLAVDWLAKNYDLDSKRVLAKLYTRQGWFLDGNEDLDLVDNAVDLISQVELAGKEVRAEKAYALYRKGILSASFGAGADKSGQILRESQDIFRSLGDDYGTADVLEVRGYVAFEQGNFDESGRLFNEALELQKTIGDRIGELYSLQGLANLARYSGEQENARTIEKQILDIHKKEGNQLALASSLNTHSATLFWLGEYQEAYATVLDSYDMFHELGLDQHSDVRFMDDVILLFTGEYERIDKYREAEDDHFESWGYFQAYVHSMIGWVAAVEHRHIESRICFERASEVAHRYQHWNEMGIMRAWLSLALRGLNMRKDSDHQLCDAFRSTLQSKSFVSLMHVLPIAAMRLACDAKHEQAVEIYELARTFPHVANAQLFEDIVGREIAAIADSLPPDLVEATRARGRERDPWATAEELLAELETENAQD